MTLVTRDVEPSLAIHVRRWSRETTAYSGPVPTGAVDPRRSSSVTTSKYSPGPTSGAWVEEAILASRRSSVAPAVDLPMGPISATTTATLVAIAAAAAGRRNRRLRRRARSSDRIARRSRARAWSIASASPSGSPNICLISSDSSIDSLASFLLFHHVLPFEAEPVRGGAHVSDACASAQCRRGCRVPPQSLRT